MCIRDSIYTECLVSGFGYTPSLWAFVPDDYYDDAKAVMKAYMEKNQQQSGISASVIAANWATFERKIDEIHNIQAVSYTHLDVYKRQLMAFQLFSLASFSMLPVMQLLLLLVTKTY